jgi:hypothetical protein
VLLFPVMRIKNAGMLAVALALSAGCGGDRVSGAGSADAAAGAPADADQGTDVAIDALAGGAGDGAGSPSACGASGVSADQRAACAEQAHAVCTRLEACAPIALVRFTGFESDAAARVLECQQLRAALCEQALRLPGLDGDPAGLRARASELTQARCPDPILDLFPWSVYTRRPGRQPAGQPCVLDDQCATGSCRSPDSGGPAGGVCVMLRDPAAVVGTPCRVVGDTVKTYSCDAAGAVCDIATVTCVRFPQEGEACVNDACVGGQLTCSAGICRRRLYLDDACDPAADVCSETHAYRCDPAARRCRHRPVEGGAAGQRCGGWPNEGFCAAGLACQYPGRDPRVHDGPGTCARYQRRGERCEAGVQCAAAYDCVAGVCRPRTLLGCE